MVQFGDVAAMQVEGEAVVSYVQPPMSSLDQLPHTSLPLSDQPPSLLFPVLPESTGTLEVPSDVLDPHSILQPAVVDSLSGLPVFQSVPFSVFSSIDNMPNTRLDADLSTAPFSEPFNFNETTSDMPSDAGRVFEVVPVVDPYSNNSDLDNMKEQSGYSLSNGLTTLGGSVDNMQALDCVAMDNQVQKKEERADSMDSLTDKSYLSDSSSDVYMNSDYTDTITSTDSSAFLLTPADCGHKEVETMQGITEAPSIAAEEAPEPSGYKNEAFTDSAKPTITLPSQSDQEREAEVAVGEGNAGNADCYIHITDEDAGMVADREDEAEDVGGPCDGVEDLVQQLVDHHPGHVVDVHVQVLDGPVYERLTEPLPGEGWLQSTESLHRYKLLKQGRFPPFSPSPASLLPRAVTNLRANTMNNLHERASFLNLTTASVTSLGRACQKALTHVRTDMEFGSMMSLRDNAKLASTLSPGDRGLLPSDTEALNGDLGKKGEPSVASGRHTRNVVYMALLITLLLIAVNATKNLQSSLNQEGGVGIMCLAVTSGAYMLGSVLSPVLVQSLGVKRCVTVGLLFQLLYVAANLHPTLWLMLPAAFGGGASLAFIWNAMSTYLVLLARGEAQFAQRPYERVSDKYFGIFCLIYQSNLIVGNLISSLILTFGDGDQADAAALLVNATANITDSVVMETASPSFLSSLEQAASDLLLAVNEGSEVVVNASSTYTAFDSGVDSHYQLCGSNYCHHFVLDQTASAVPARTVYLLFGIFLFLIVVALVMSLCLLEPISPHLFAPRAARTSAWRTVRNQVVSLAKFCRNAKFLLLLPLMLYTAMQFSFVCSEVMLAYVTCPVGVWMVGFTMMAYGISCSLSCYLTQLLVPRTGRAPFITVGAVLNIGLLVFMRLWQPHPDSILPLFVITAIFGFSDGIWNVLANGLCGSVFPDHFEEAFTGLRIAQGLGGVFSMAYAPFFSMAVKIYTMIGVTVCVFVGYFGAEVLIKRDARKKAVLFEKEIV